MRELGIVAAPSAAVGKSRPRDRAVEGEGLEFAPLYDEWFEHVARWIRALGAPQGDVEDIAQEVFLVVRRRLRDFDGRNLPGWLYRIASRQVRQHRRSFWQRVFSQRATSPIEHIPRTEGSPSSALEEKERRALVERLLNRMSETRRVAFILFEIEGYSGEEIAEILDIPLGTVWTRLHHARKEFFGLLAQRRRSNRGDA
jgi:RNA polymerase sigma-70 factor (ECF subfamily)